MNEFYVEWFLSETNPLYTIIMAAHLYDMIKVQMMTEGLKINSVSVTEYCKSIPNYADLRKVRNIVVHNISDLQRLNDTIGEVSTDTICQCLSLLNIDFNRDIIASKWELAISFVQVVYVAMMDVDDVVSAYKVGDKFAR